MVNTLDFLRSVFPGMSTLVQLDDPERTVAVAVREDEAGLARYGNSVKMQPGLIAKTIEGVVVICFVVRLNDRTDATFETYLNVRTSDRNGRPVSTGMEMLDSLCSQPRIVVSFVTERGVRRHIACDSHLQSSFRAIKQAAAGRHWTMKEFDIAKARFQREFDPEALGNLLFGTGAASSEVQPCGHMGPRGGKSLL